MALLHLPSHGWRVTYPTELREYSSMEASRTSDMYSVVSLRAVPLGRYSTLFFTNDLPLVLQEATITIYADDCTLHTSAPTASEFNETLRSYSQCKNG